MKLFGHKKEKVNPKKIYGFDIETIMPYNYFYMGSIVGDNNLKKVFYDQQSMIKFILKNKLFRGNCYLVASNLQFDLLALFENTKHFEKLKMILRGSDIIYAYYPIGKKIIKTNTGSKEYCRSKIEMIDTGNFLKVSVARLGKILKLPKLKQPKCLGKIPKNKKELKELTKYNLRDSEISYKFLKFIQEGYNKFDSNMKITVASSSLNLFRQKYLKNAIRTPEVKSIDTMHKGYYGGRVETYRRGSFQEKFYYYDVNSLYPHVMRYEYPNPNFLQTGKSSKHIINNYHGLSNVTLVTPKEDKFLLPVKKKVGDTLKLIFPIGKIKGWYTHVELKEALKNGSKILNYDKSIFFKRSFYPFKNFIKDRYESRLKYKEEKNPMEVFEKLNMNSLYGKFAQKIDGKQEIIHANQVTMDMIKSWARKGYDINQVNNFFYVTDNTKTKVPSFINPILSIYTTAYARITMYDYLNNNNVCYSDTDSIITTKKLRTGDKLGQLKLEHKTNEGIIIKSKMYCFINSDGYPIIKSKGVPMKCFKGLQKHECDKCLKCYDHFINFLKTRKISYKKFCKFKETIRSKKEYKHGKLVFNQVIDVIKKVGLEDDKRVWKNKFCVKNFEKSKPIVI